MQGVAVSISRSGTRAVSRPASLVRSVVPERQKSARRKMGLTRGSGWEEPGIRFEGTQSQEMLWHPEWRMALHQSTRWARGGNEANGELARPIGDGYELYFPYACNTCGRSEFTGTKLMTCRGCGIVKYCCAEHQKLDWPKHKHMCKAIQRCKTVFNSFFRERTGEEPERPSNSEEFAAYFEFMHKIMLTDPVINEIFADDNSAVMERSATIDILRRQPRCIFCYTEKKLTPCGRCAGVAICENCLRDRSQEEIDERHPPDACQRHAVAAGCMGFVSDFGNPIFMPSRTPCDTFALPTSWIEYLAAKREDFGLPNDAAMLTLAPAVSMLLEGLSLPLTILKALYKLLGDDLENREELEVHILDASIGEVFCLQRYAEISIMLPRLRTLRICFIGKKMKNMNGKLEDQHFHDGLDKYMRPECKAVTEVALVDYAEYIRVGCAETGARWRKPDLAVIPNKNFTGRTDDNKEWSWKEAVDAIMTHKVPCLCTEPTQKKVKSALAVLADIITRGGFITDDMTNYDITMEENEFHGLRPHGSISATDNDSEEEEFDAFGFSNAGVIIFNK